MHSKSIPLFFIVAFLTSTSLGLDHLAARSFDIILARQENSGVCDSICGIVQSSVTACNALTSCICTSAIEADVQGCVNCAIAADPSVNVTESAQQLIDNFEAVCSTVPGIPTVTLSNNAGTPQSTPNTATLPSATSVPTSQIAIGPSSTTSTPNNALSAGSTSTASVGGFPLNSSASSNKIIFHWIIAFLGLAAGNLLV